MCGNLRGSGSVYPHLSQMVFDLLPARAAGLQILFPRRIFFLSVSASDKFLHEPGDLLTGTLFLPLLYLKFLLRLQY